jgi:hypothetical protein
MYTREMTYQIKTQLSIFYSLSALTFLEILRNRDHSKIIYRCLLKTGEEEGERVKL